MDAFNSVAPHVYGSFILNDAYEIDEKRNKIFIGYKYELKTRAKARPELEDNQTYKGIIQPDAVKLNPPESSE